MNKAYRFRIYPNKEQRAMLAKTFGCCRFIYNRMLSDKAAYYRQCGKMLQTTPASYKEEFPWLKEADSLALANEQLHLERAYKNFFRQKEAGFPKFKSRHDGNRSYTTNLVNGNIKLGNGRIKLPKMSSIKIILHRAIPDNNKVKSVTVSQEPSGNYYVSILCAYENQAGAQMAAGTENILGIDFAMGGLAVFSDGTRAEYPMYYRKMEVRLKREQRRLSKCMKGSNNYRRQRIKTARLHEKIRNTRKDYQHKLSRRLANEMDVICVEDLNMKAMSQRLHLGKSVMDNGYSQFLNLLEYKLMEQGKQLVKVDRFYPSSKTCSMCGRIKEDLELSERVYRCECGNQMDRDLNAAINIREEGKRKRCA